MSSGHSEKSSLAALVVGALGIVYGDIGTSPLYAFKESLHAAGGLKATNDDVYGILSLIIWSLVMVVAVKYLTFIMRADNHGEGGIFALLALAPGQMRSATPGRVSFVSLLAVAGAALLYGDGVITPAISVLSAVEGLAIADPRTQAYVVPITVGILLGLFSIQSYGTGTVGKLFGPIMVVWFSVLAALGVYHIAHDPQILGAVSPLWAIDYFQRHGWPGLHILASVILAVTGGEALYADMGHFGIKPIRLSWFTFVMPSLLLAYFGQGALVLREHHAIENPFFTMVPKGWATYALVVLASAATVIASQALISGAFSLTRQAMQLGFFPRVRICHTAHEMEGQIYVPQVNFLLAVGCIWLVLTFKESSRLAAAYGIAVAGTMLLTSVLFGMVMRERWGWSWAKSGGLLALFLACDIPFLVANLYKFTDGGYVPILIGAAVLTVMLLWNRGRTLVAQRYAIRFPSLDVAQKRVESRLAHRVPGTAVFMSSNEKALPPVLVHHVERSRSLQETVILLTVVTENEPTVPAENRYRVTPLDDGFWRLVIRFGFMEEPYVPPVLADAVARHGVPFPAGEVTYYLGRENFVASSKGQMGAIAESIFAFLTRNAVAADRYFGLPHRHVVEIGTQMDL
jgi:KUP system potassium uptake protein